MMSISRQTDIAATNEGLVLLSQSFGGRVLVLETDKADVVEESVIKDLHHAFSTIKEENIGMM